MLFFAPLIAAGGAVFGGFFGGMWIYLAQKDTQDRERLKKDIEELKGRLGRWRLELQARMAEEETAVRWIMKLDNQKYKAAQDNLRQKTETRWNKRPNKSPSDVGYSLDNPVVDEWAAQVEGP